MRSDACGAAWSRGRLGVRVDEDRPHSGAVGHGLDELRQQVDDHRVRSVRHRARPRQHGLERGANADNGARSVRARACAGQRARACAGQRARSAYVRSRGDGGRQFGGDAEHGANAVLAQHRAAARCVVAAERAGGGPQSRAGRGGGRAGRREGGREGIGAGEPPWSAAVAQASTWPSSPYFPMKSVGGRGRGGGRGGSGVGSGLGASGGDAGGEGRRTAERRGARAAPYGPHFPMVVARAGAFWKWRMPCPRPSPPLPCPPLPCPCLRLVFKCLYNSASLTVQEVTGRWIGAGACQAHGDRAALTMARPEWRCATCIDQTPSNTRAVSLPASRPKPTLLPSSLALIPSPHP